jgi:predicted hotdog family 3-hydroxylacyl-ACP dehydratase
METLPQPVDRLVPHRPPLRLVHRLLEAAGGIGCAEAQVEAGSPFVDRHGRLTEPALLELIAQTCAAVRGWEGRTRGAAPRQGFLVGASGVRILGTARAGDRLLVRVRQESAFEDFFVVDGEVWHGEHRLAAGRLNLWVEPDALPGAPDHGAPP